MTVAETVRAVGLPLDGRGLIELSVARKHVAALAEFRKGAGRIVHDSNVLDSDIAWACLMSLADTAEFVREASRIQWFFHPRQSQNLDPLERYGAGIFPWLAAFAQGGVLRNVPWCVRALLNELGTREAWDLLESCYEVVEDDREGPGPFASDSTGDVDDAGIDLSPPAPSERSDAAETALLDFAQAHPEIALPPLMDKSAAGDEGAQLLIQMLFVTIGPSAGYAAAVAALGKEAAAARFEALGLPTALSETLVESGLDQSAESGGGWPTFFQADSSLAYQSLRLVVLREEEGDGWVVLFERLEGSTLDELCISRYASSLVFGNGILPVRPSCELFLDADWDEDGDNALVGPEGELSVNRELLSTFEPLRATASDVDDLHETLLIRAYLDYAPTAFWTDPDELADDLGLEGYAVLLVSDGFQHTVPPDSEEEDPEGVDAHLRGLPGESPVFKSLTRAIAARDPSLFEPGESNLHWRLHLGKTDLSSA